MISRWTSLSAAEQGAFRTAIASLEGRLEESETFNWALRLKHSSAAEKLAILFVLDRLKVLPREPWRSAWALLEESWHSDKPVDREFVSSHSISRELRAGDRSGVLVLRILEFLGPRLVAEPPFVVGKSVSTLKNPRTVSQLAHFHISSFATVADSPIEGLSDTSEAFLLELAHVLDASIVRASDIAKRLGWTSEEGFWRLGELHRVAYSGELGEAVEEQDPDRFHRGIAPAVRLLHRTVVRLCELGPSGGAIVKRWSLRETPVHFRLWAAMARDSALASGSDLANAFQSSDDNVFWNINSYPEFAELRAIRFDDVGDQAQRYLTRRIMKGPPGTWFRRVEKARRSEVHTYWIARELQRIRVAGSTLTVDAENWLQRHVGAFEDIQHMDSVDAGFPSGISVRWAQRRPDRSFDLMTGLGRLAALDAGLAAKERSLETDDARSASAWLQEESNLRAVIADLVAAGEAAFGFATLWDQIGWFNSPPKGHDGNPPLLDLHKQNGYALLDLTIRLPDSTLTKSIRGVANWMDRWASFLWPSDSFFSAWQRIWPLAANATNQDFRASKEDTEDHTLSFLRPQEEREERQIDTLNNPTGNMVGAFLTCCPPIRDGEAPFGDQRLRTMREQIVSFEGRANLIGRLRLTESLAWFLVADPDWTRHNLIEPLRRKDENASSLWAALARGRFSQTLIREIGDEMLARTIDQSLSRSTRQSLVFNLLVNCLYSLYDRKDPLIPLAKVTQTIRGLDAEVRAHAATVPLRFVRDLTAIPNADEPRFTAEDIAVRSIIPFLGNVWPQERSLAQPSIARAFSGLPARCGRQFVSVVDAIEPFLVPFDCWALYEYQFSASGDEGVDLDIIDSNEAAEALLRLLDATIGLRDDSVVPHDLSVALARIIKVNEKLVRDARFRRLSARVRL